MGSMQAMDMANQVAEGNTSLTQALTWHLQCNHYPPVPVSFVPVCITAIEYASDGDWDALVELPDGMSYKGNDNAPVWAIVEAHHLGGFVTEQDDYDEWEDDEDDMTVVFG